MLSTIYEEEFLGFSYGFRPKRSQHDALDALVVGITSTKVNWILEVDVRSFFDEVSQSWLMRFLTRLRLRPTSCMGIRGGVCGLRSSLQGLPWL